MGRAGKDGERVVASNAHEHALLQRYEMIMEKTGVHMASQVADVEPIGNENSRASADEASLVFNLFARRPSARLQLGSLRHKASADASGAPDPLMPRHLATTTELELANMPEHLRPRRHWTHWQVDSTDLARQEAIAACAVDYEWIEKEGKVHWSRMSNPKKLLVLTNPQWLQGPRSAEAAGKATMRKPTTDTQSDGRKTELRARIELLQAGRRTRRRRRQILRLARTLGQNSVQKLTVKNASRHEKRLRPPIKGLVIVKGKPPRQLGGTIDWKDRQCRRMRHVP